MSQREVSFVRSEIRSSARDARHADSEGRRAWADSWLWHFASHPADFKRGSPGTARLALSRAASPGKARLAGGRLGRIGERAASEVLPAVGEGQEAIAGRAVELGPAIGSGGSDHADGAVGCRDVDALAEADLARRVGDAETDPRTRNPATSGAVCSVRQELHSIERYRCPRWRHIGRAWKHVEPHRPLCGHA